MSINCPLRALLWLHTCLYKVTLRGKNLVMISLYVYCTCGLACCEARFCHGDSQHGAGIYVCDHVALLARCPFNGYQQFYGTWMCCPSAGTRLHIYQCRPKFYNLLSQIFIIPYKKCLVCCRISGVVNTGEHLVCEPLTTAVHMLDLRPHQPHLMRLMALACRALRETELALWKGYEDGSLQSIAASELPYPLR